MSMAISNHNWRHLRVTNPLNDRCDSRGMRYIYELYIRSVQWHEAYTKDNYNDFVSTTKVSMNW